MTSRALLLYGAVLALPLVGCTGPAEPPARIVLVTFDTTRADRLGCYGNEEGLTPELDRFAAEAVLFEQAVAQAPTTLPSHGTMFTGLYPQDHGLRYNLMFRLAPDAFTLAEGLSEAGYATAAFPAAYVLDRKYGLDQGFETFVNPPEFRTGEAIHPDDRTRSAGEGVDLALDWLAKHEGEPVFVWLHFYDPHHPYRPPFPWSARFRDRPYEGEIAYADEQFGRLYERLREDDDWDRTLLAVAGDHGEGLHDHDEAYHAYLVYETTQHVPLLIRTPGTAQARVGEPVVLADLMPTILDLAGVPIPADLRGISLRPALAGSELPRRDLYFESLSGALAYGWGELNGVRRGRWKLIDSDSPELFDLDSDPAESTNLAGLEPERVEDMRAALHALLEPLDSQVRPDQAQEPVLDAETQLFLASLGYVGGTTGGASTEGARHPREVVDMANELLVAQRAVALERWDVVLDLCTYVQQRDPSNKWALTNSIGALLHLHRAREAQDVGAEMVRLYPDNDRSYELWARTYRAQELTQTAYDVLRQGLEAVPDSELLAYLSLVAAFELERPAACSDELSEALAQHPRSGRILVLQARCEAASGDAEAALRTLGTAVDVGFHELERLKEAEDFLDVVRLLGFAELVERSNAEQEN